MSEMKAGQSGNLGSLRAELCATTSQQRFVLQQQWHGNTELPVTQTPGTELQDNAFIHSNFQFRIHCSMLLFYSRIREEGNCPSLLEEIISQSTWRYNSFINMMLRNIKAQGFLCLGSLLGGAILSCCLVVAAWLNCFKDPDVWDSAMGNLGLVRASVSMGSVAVKGPRSKIRLCKCDCQSGSSSHSQHPLSLTRRLLGAFKT